MAHNDDIALMAHLMRRAGFGAGRDELEARVAKGYDATVEELLNPETQPPVDPYTLLRYQPSALLPGGVPPMGNVNYMYYLVTTQRPLEEKMALFWHHVLATGNSKVDNYDQLLEQIDLFREQGMGNYRELLLTISKNPSMIFWLDNNQNHGTEVIENWGRELLELFSLGAGNYTEVDVREASRAFTGWTFGTKIPRACRVRSYRRYAGPIYGRPRLCKDKISCFGETCGCSHLFGLSNVPQPCDTGLDGRSANQLPITLRELEVRCAQRALLIPGLARLCHHSLFILATTSTSRGRILNLRCSHRRALSRMPISSAEHQQRPNDTRCFVCDRDNSDIRRAAVFEHCKPCPGTPPPAHD
jgi:hypothetical protein